MSLHLFIHLININVNGFLSKIKGDEEIHVPLLRDRSFSVNKNAYPY